MDNDEKYGDEEVLYFIDGKQTDYVEFYEKFDKAIDKLFREDEFHDWLDSRFGTIELRDKKYPMSLVIHEISDDYDDLKEEYLGMLSDIHMDMLEEEGAVSINTTKFEIVEINEPSSTQTQHLVSSLKRKNNIKSRQFVEALDDDTTEDFEYGVSFVDCE